MKNNHLIVLEVVNALQLVCHQVNVMLQLTGREVNNAQLQLMLDKRVEEFKLLYTEIPKDSQFIVEITIAKLLVISSNQAFREFADAANNAVTKQTEAPVRQYAGLVNTLH